MSGFNTSHLTVGGSVDLSDGTDAIEIKPASTAATFADTAMVVEIRPGGSFPAKGTAAMAASIPVTIATDDTQTTAIKNSVAAIPAKGTAAMAAATPVTIATDDTVFTALTNKFPTAAIPADADANTGAAATVTRIASRLWGYNAATWDAIRTGLTAVQTAFTGMMNTLPVGKYNATQPTLADANGVNLQVDSRGNLRVISMGAPQAQDDLNQLLAVQIRTPVGTTYAPSVFTDRGATVTKLVKGSAGMVVGLTCYNTTASTRFLQLHNLVAAPASGAPALSFLVPAGAQIVLGTDIFTSAGISFATGIVYGVSSTSDSYTAGSATDCSIQIFYY